MPLRLAESFPAIDQLLLLLRMLGALRGREKLRHRYAKSRA